MWKKLSLATTKLAVSSCVTCCDSPKCVVDEEKMKNKFEWNLKRLWKLKPRKLKLVTKSKFYDIFHWPPRPPYFTLNWKLKWKFFSNFSFSVSEVLLKFFVQPLDGGVGMNDTLENTSSHSHHLLLQKLKRIFTPKNNQSLSFVRFLNKTTKLQFHFFAEIKHTFPRGYFCIRKWS